MVQQNLVNLLFNNPFYSVICTFFINKSQPTVHFPMIHQSACFVKSKQNTWEPKYEDKQGSIQTIVYRTWSTVPWEMCEDQGPFLRRHFFLLCTELIKQLFAHCLEDRPKKCTAEDKRCLVARQTVAECWHVAVAEPSGGNRLQTQSVVKKTVIEDYSRMVNLQGEKCVNVCCRICTFKNRTTDIIHAAEHIQRVACEKIKQ